jgi:hypothetical protein
MEKIKVKQSFMATDNTEEQWRNKPLTVPVLKIKMDRYMANTLLGASLFTTTGLVFHFLLNMISFYS